MASKANVAAAKLVASVAETPNSIDCHAARERHGDRQPDGDADRRRATGPRSGPTHAMPRRLAPSARRMPNSRR